MRACPRCQESLAPEFFYKGRSPYCKVCTRARQRDYNARNAEAISMRRREARNTPEGIRKSKNRDLVRHYGITLDEWESMFAAQAGNCAICRDPLAEGKHTHVDHDHETGAVRGLLCVHCNLMLGHAKKGVHSLRMAIAYLERHEPR